MLKLLLLLLPAAAYCQTRPKEVDENYQRLVALSSVGTSCKRSDTGVPCQQFYREREWELLLCHYFPLNG